MNIILKKLHNTIILIHLLIINGYKKINFSIFFNEIRETYTNIKLIIFRHASMQQ